MNEDLVMKTVKEFCLKHNLVTQGDRVVVCVSLGKDSVVLYHVFKRLSKEMNFDVVPLVITFPKHKYGNDVLKKLCNVIPGATVLEPEYNDEVLTTTSNPCEVCKAIRRHYIKKFVYEQGINKVATGHTLWDLYAYILEFMLVTGFKLEKLLKVDRGLEILSRFLPKFTSIENVTVIHPLICIGEDMTEYLAKKVLKYPIARECMYRSYRPKRLLTEFLRNVKISTSYEDITSFVAKYVDFRELTTVLSRKSFADYIV